MAAPKGNLFALGLDTSGRPPIYSDDEDGFKEYKDRCISFFEYCESTKQKATITGLALYLGFSSRGTLNEYSKKKVFSDITKRAMLMVENSYELGGNTIDIFALKNMGWKDKTETDNTHRGDITITRVIKK